MGQAGSNSSQVLFSVLYGYTVLPKLDKLCFHGADVDRAGCQRLWQSLSLLRVDLDIQSKLSHDPAGMLGGDALYSLARGTQSLLSDATQLPCWGSPGHMVVQLFFFSPVLWIKPRTSCVLSKHLAMELQPQLLFLIFEEPPYHSPTIVKLVHVPISIVCGFFPTPLSTLRFSTSRHSDRWRRSHMRS